MSNIIFIPFPHMRCYTTFYHIPKVIHNISDFICWGIIIFINKFYNQKQFNFIYSQWLNNNKTSRTFYDLYKPSIDHILPKSKGGTNDLDNLQFLTVFENLCKRDMTAEEWILFKKENNIKGDIFLEGVVLWDMPICILILNWL